MAEIQSQISAPASQSDISEQDLVARLDELLERYLRTLDEYQKAQQLLTKHLSSGYLSLAQANFNNRTSTRYGQDYYDERMQASRKITLTGNQESNPTFSATSTQDPLEKDTKTSTPKDAHMTDDPVSNPDPATENQTTGNQQPQKSTTSIPKNPTDPLKWFGILVPNSLRTAQSSFISVVEGPIPHLATLSQNLRGQEIEIGRVRKMIKKVGGN